MGILEEQSLRRSRVRRALRLMVILAASSAGGLCQNAYYLPYFADGGYGGSAVRSSIVLSNPGAGTVKASIAWSGDDGSSKLAGVQGFGRSASLSLVLPPGASSTLKSDASGDGSTLGAVVKSDYPLSVSLLLANSDASGAPDGESVVEAPEVLPVSRIVLDPTAGVTAGVALFNPGATALAVTAT